jgi:hypothetical protein
MLFRKRLAPSIPPSLWIYSAYSIHLWFLAHMVSGAYEKMSWKLQNLSIEFFFARENQKFKMATETVQIKQRIP